MTVYNMCWVICQDYMSLLLFTWFGLTKVCCKLWIYLDRKLSFQNVRIYLSTLWSWFNHKPKASFLYRLISKLIIWIFCWNGFTLCMRCIYRTFTKLSLDDFKLLQFKRGKPKTFPFFCLKSRVITIRWKQDEKPQL